MPNYFKVKQADGTFKQAEINGCTILGEGKKGTGNAAEQSLAKYANIPIETITEINKEEYEEMK